MDAAFSVLVTGGHSLYAYLSPIPKSHIGSYHQSVPPITRRLWHEKKLSYPKNLPIVPIKHVPLRPSSKATVNKIQFHITSMVFVNVNMLFHVIYSLWLTKLKVQVTRRINNLAKSLSVDSKHHAVSQYLACLVWPWHGEKKQVISWYCLTKWCFSSQATPMLSVRLWHLTLMLKGRQNTY